MLFPLAGSAQDSFTLSSPDGKITVDIDLGERVTYAVRHDGDLLLAPSAVSMTLDKGQYGVNPKLRNASRKSVDQTIDAHFYKRDKVADKYNELTLSFRGDYSIVYRAYDDGVAYRFVSHSRKPFVVKDEQAEFNFPADHNAWIPYVARSKGTIESQFFTSFESLYDYIPLSKWDKERLGIAPLLVESANGKKLCITEADLMNYPGMFLYNGDGGHSLRGVFAPVPKELEQGGHNNLQMLVKSREDYIAKFDKGEAFPWRTIVISATDKELADNDMVYKLATPSKIKDISWIKPGKVAWEWWNNCNLSGVDFRTGINNDTYKYYIDFAAKNGVEYVILDEGWAVKGKADLMQVVPQIDLAELIGYAAEKSVGIILWAGYWAFDRDMENVCKHYSQMGVKGFKIDFMDRDDRVLVDFHRRAAETAAKYKMLVDFHGTYKPTGLHRTYPNVLNYEGVFGLEQVKWTPNMDQVAYDVTMPYIRMLAGPVDYTQGAMRNANRGNYRSVGAEPMSQGTRCHQLAEYVVFESPVNMLCDSPTNYMKEEECLAFIAQIPTVWNETVAVNGEVGKYITIARRSGDEWYVGALTNWAPRQLELDLSFLPAGDYIGEIFRDGANADKVAADYKKQIVDIPADRKLTAILAPGGGYAIRIKKK